MVVYNMATTLRHNDLVADLRSEIYYQHREQVRSKKLKLADEEIALVYEGNLEEEWARLIDVESIQNMEMFKSSTIDLLRYVQPDFFLFTSNNPYVTNSNETRVAGRPDLVVEVWSEGNFDDERRRKFLLYSSSANTEHWYIEQNSNLVVCYLGKNRALDQNLSDVIKTHCGFEIDLRHLALPQTPD